MLSRKQMWKLIKATYGSSNKFTRQIKQMYNTASLQIKGEISRFLQSGDNWQGKPSKDNLEQIREELQQLQDDDNVAPLVAVFLSAVTLGHPKNSDVETGRLAVPLIKVAQKRHQQMQRINQQIPHDVQKISKEQSVLTPQLHKIPFNYNVMMQQQVSDSVTRRAQTRVNINRDIQQTINRVRDVCKKASQDTDARHNYVKDIDRIINGRTSGGGASRRAQTIMRSETCAILNNSTVQDFQARGVQQYRFMSLEASNTCQECADMDGNTYDVDEAQEGVNLPPIHPNCQCWIVEITENQ